MSASAFGVYLKLRDVVSFEAETGCFGVASAGGIWIRTALKSKLSTWYEVCARNAVAALTMNTRMRTVFRMFSGENELIGAIGPDLERVVLLIPGAACLSGKEPQGYYHRV